jgi:putative acetyltransferase
MKPRKEGGIMESRSKPGGILSPTIRRGGAEDVDALMRIWSEAARAAHPFVPGEGRGARAREVRERFLPAADLLVAEEAGRPVGFAAVIGDELAGLFVAPIAQGTGIGRWLLEAALAAHGALTVSVFEKNARGLAFYRRNGFAGTDRGLDPETAEVVVRLAREGGR